MRDYPTSQKFRDHIIEYIENNCGNDALSVWYKLNITGIDNEDYIVTFLENNLKDEFIVNVEDFIDYINKKNEKILLFLKLRRYKYFYLKDGKLTETSLALSSLLTLPFQLLPSFKFKITEEILSATTSPTNS